MSKINAAAFAAGVLTLLVLLTMSQFPFVPLWALFIAWACYFHLGGGEKPEATFAVAVVHISIGVIASWLSALLLFANPLPGELGALLWGPLVIGLAIGILVRLSLLPWLAATPAIIYGYASIWAFLSVPGRFDLGALLSVSFNNAGIAILAAMLLGLCMGYANVRLVSWLTRESAVPVAMR